MNTEEPIIPNAADQASQPTLNFNPAQTAETDFGRLEVDKLSDLEGKKIQLDDFDFLLNGGATIDGESLSLNDLSPDAEFQVTDVAGNIAELQIGNSRITITEDELLPHIKAVQ